eukprot:SAG31_NODE_875_length_11316_cov_8.924044_9_plen_80_part_00
MIFVEKQLEDSHIQKELSTPQLHERLNIFMGPCRQAIESAMHEVLTRTPNWFGLSGVELGLPLIIQMWTRPLISRTTPT